MLGHLKAIGTSCRLVWGNWWRTLGVLVVICIVYIVLVLAVYFLVNAVHHVFGDAATVVLPGDLSLLDILGTILSQLVWLPLFGAVLVTMFHDLKLRHQGFDLEKQVSQISPYR